ncbi:unnamed protein product [Candidula unifasciata]|uniref:USP domain-containing protein n=1 Tax=Candidula unifasciata TaxID=100452 RepID=A0A8S3YZW5_9EUPU|nr:unnamed protein product [Candidula unifasciata]
MFGNLFNEDMGQQGAAASAVSVIPSPPGHRLDCGLAGIDNQGATCYLNSLLQTLLLTPEFREKLFMLTEQDLGSLRGDNSSSSKVRAIPLQLQRLFSQLLLSDQQSVSTTDLTNSFGWTNREEFQQHDVQELNRILFSAIEESLVGTPAQNIINELYHGTVVNQIVCSKCKKISEREEDFLDLTLAVAGVSGLESALKQSYCDVEVMDGRNQYRCEICQTYTDATKGAKLRTLPPLLTVSLLRFSYDFVKMSRYKENGRFTFPMQLDMSPYSEKGSTEDNDNLYDLFSVVVHRGSAFGGHYFAYIRDIDNLGHWVHPDGATVERKVDPSVTGLDVIECQSPVDLVENILGKESHCSMSITRLCAEITKVTGVSWNKRFKKAHGPINKFLKSCSLFEYNPDSNWVSLRSSVPEPGQRWFCFNDSVVTPIQTTDIERQFSGKESAYMLFYRKKSLYRPEEGLITNFYFVAFCHTRFNTTTGLLQEVRSLGNFPAWEQVPQDYEKTINTITVKVFLAEHFTYNGLLQIKGGVSFDAAHCPIEIDRRSSFQYLRARIKETLVDSDVHNFSVHRMKARCGSFHLYEELTDESGTLQDLNLTSDSFLFVWNGAVMNDSFVNCGEECEPIELVIKDPDENILVYVTLAKNKCLSDLYKAVTDKTGCQTYHLLACKPGENDSKLSESSDTTLATAGLKDGDTLLMVLPNSNSSPHLEGPINGTSGVEASGDPKWSITLLNRLAGNDNPHTCKSIPMRTTASTTLMELKLQALNLLQVDSILFDTTRLRQNHQTMGLYPPLREGLTLADAGLSNGVFLVLENGKPPQDSEMTVRVNKVVGGKLLSVQEFLVDRQQTVSEMLQTSCKLMNCEGTHWYLSKTDAFGDPADPLEDSTATLLDLLINDGDTLVLQQGSFLKKDQVCVSVWLAPYHQPSPTALKEVTGGGDVAMQQDEEDKVMLELAAKLSLNECVSSNHLNPLNDRLYPDMEQLFEAPFVIPKSMSVEELKQALMSTEKIQTLRIPTSNFMRLRLIEGSRLKAVIRNNSQVLKHISTKETVSLAVQVLNFEENLGVHETLLLLARKIGGTRIYMPAQEFLWNTSSGVGAGDLKRVIATRLSLPLHDVLIAKYNPEVCEWIVLRDQPQKVPKNKGKKKSSAHKTNVRQAPYFIQDGDLIGVKLLSADKGILDADDFSTQEDIEKRQLILQAAEEKKRMREDKKKTQTDTFPVVRRPEVPLTIRVDKFS